MKWLPTACVVLCVSGASSPVAQEEAVWVRTGVFWSVETLPEDEPIIDDARLAEQRALGCSGSDIAFGDTAQMRGLAADSDWPPEVRDHVVTSALSDDKEDALSQIATALAHDGLSETQVAALENRHILTALQFGDRAFASDLLDRYGLPDELPGPLLSDRLFWSAYLGLGRDDRATWFARHAPGLREAMRLDPTSFQVRYLRAVGYIGHSGWDGSSCPDAVRAFSDLLLDMSDAGSCPLMVGHMSFALEAEVSAMKTGRLSRQTRDWTAFANGLLGVISGNAAVVEEQTKTLVEGHTSACAPLMSRELTRIGAL